MNEIYQRQKELFKILPELNSFVMHIQNQKNFDIQKKGEIDIVTRADTGAEKQITDFIRKNFPSDSILGEESGSYQGNNRYRWIIDPIDGTTNFAHGLPLYAIAIGLENRETEELLMGVVSLPALHDLYHAIRGEGAFKNSIPISVSKSGELINSLLCTGFPYKVKERSDQIMDIFTNYLVKVRGIRRTGSACLDLCWLAEGRYDAFWEEDLKPWDTAAATMIVKEAGGTITDFYGKPFSPFGNTILASNSIIHEALLKEINKYLYVHLNMEG